MYKLIGENNKVNYGSVDELLDFNYMDFKLLDFFDKEIKGFKKKFAFHTFNYIGIISENYLIGVAVVNLGYLANIFAFIYDYKKGKIYECITNQLPSKIDFPLNPDEYEIKFSGKNISLKINKSHKKNQLLISGIFDGKLEISAMFNYGLKNKPLRVINPSCGDPHRFTFTEKCSPLSVKQVSIKFEGNDLNIKPQNTTAIYDWSGGYLNRNTNWLWSAFGGQSNKNMIGANFAALVNESYYPENAFWINNKRTRTSNVIYDINMNNPYEDWRIFTENGDVDLVFHPFGERSDKRNMFFVKLNFRQFIGEYSGKFKDQKVKIVKFEKIRGLAEIHYSLW